MRNLLDQIQCEDTDFKLAISKAIKSDEKKADFKLTALHVIPKCPVVRKRMMKTSKTKKAEMSAATSNDPNITVDDEGDIFANKVLVLDPML